MLALIWFLLLRFCCSQQGRSRPIIPQPYLVIRDGIGLHLPKFDSSFKYFGRYSQINNLEEAPRSYVPHHPNYLPIRPPLLLTANAAVPREIPQRVVVEYVVPDSHAYGWTGLLSPLVWSSEEDR